MVINIQVQYRARIRRPSLALRVEIGNKVSPEIEYICYETTGNKVFGLS